MDEPFTTGSGDEYEYHHDDNDSVTNTVPLYHNILTVLYSFIFLLGVNGNGLVIWILGFKMKKSINTTWYLSRAISDFIVCASIPFDVFDMCNFHQFNTFVTNLTMFSSIFLLVLISVDRCVSGVFPVWSQNHRTVKAASALVLLAWVASAVLSTPSAVFSCEDSSYPTDQAIIVTEFVCGFLIPFAVITVCYTVIFWKLTRNRMTKPFKVMTALIVTFCICWLPYHTVKLLALYHHNLNQEALEMGLHVSLILTYVNSVLNPILYVFMGDDFKLNFKNCIFSKIENATVEEA